MVYIKRKHKRRCRRQEKWVLITNPLQNVNQNGLNKLSLQRDTNRNHKGYLTKA
jgi:hypothetical protein